MFCPDLKGIITQTNIGWAHITCVNYTNEIWYELDGLNMTVTGKINYALKSPGQCKDCKFGKKRR